MIAGRAELADSAPGLAAHRILVHGNDGAETVLEADVVLIATGASPRILDTADSRWGKNSHLATAVRTLKEFPEHLIVIGSGVTGAEFASAYNEIGVKVTLVSSRDRVLPSEDADAAAVIEAVFTEHGGSAGPTGTRGFGRP